MASQRSKPQSEPVEPEQSDRQSVDDSDATQSVGVRLLDGSVYSIDMIDAVSDKREFGDAFPTVRVKIAGEWHQQSRFETAPEAAARAKQLASLRFGSQPDSIIGADSYRAPRAPRPLDTITAARFVPTPAVRSYERDPDRIEGAQPLAAGATRTIPKPSEQTVVLRDGDKALMQREPDRSPIIDEIIAQADEESVMRAESGTVPL